MGKGAKERGYFYLTMETDPKEHSIPGTSLKILQYSKGYKVNEDSFFLADFVTKGKYRQIVDLGCGNGILLLLLSHRMDIEKGYGVEIQAEPADMAKHNMQLNDLQEKFEIIKGDIRQIREILTGGASDLVISNPPYHRVGTGKLSPDEHKAKSRGELLCQLEDLVSAASYLLKNKGRFALIYNPWRLSELLEVLKMNKLEPKRIRMMYPRPGARASHVMVEALKQGRTGLIVEPPLFRRGKLP